MSKDRHPSIMSRQELELEVTASRIVSCALTDCVENGDLQYTAAGVSKMRLAGARVRSIYSHPHRASHKLGH